MRIDTAEHEVATIAFRCIWNSHLKKVPEFCLTLENGNTGTGASPQGETTSIYEDKVVHEDARGILACIREDGVLNRTLTQSSWDRYLHTKIAHFGRNNCWALSLAFFDAANFPLSKFWRTNDKESNPSVPRLCLNILNGGIHAYTNPVLSDFPEFLLVPMFDGFHDIMSYHASIQELVRERLTRLERVQINRNWVHRFKTRDNRECLDFLAGVLETLKLTEQFMIMVDASAGDLQQGGRYRFSITDQSLRTTEELVAYWQSLQREYRLGFLEDPFAEEDYSGWSDLTKGSQGCYIVGDNLYASDPVRLERGGCEQFSTGAIIKPNQAGSVSAVRDGIEVCRKTGLVAITSHRSISTESVFLSTITMLENVGYMKIGPLLTDYSSVIRLNELVRLTGVEHE